jgi:NAD(P)H-quinone oxidoreductase subunit K
MKPVPPILTGQYLEAQTRQAPPKELAQSLGMPFVAQQPVEERADAEVRART